MNACTLPSSRIVLHVWPGQWTLPSFDPQCLATLLYLQLAIPGQFCVAECSYPELSPTGQLPFLTHEQHVVAPCTAIIKYISGLSNSEHTIYSNANLDAHLTTSEKSRRTAWSSHASSHLGDLVHHSFYAINENWVNLTHPSLASMFHVPQRYYVPRRIRDSYIPRLESVGLWSPHVEDSTKETSFQKQQKTMPIENLKSNTTLSQAFQRERVIEKARTELEIYYQLLSGKEYIFQNRLSSVDVIVAAHILLLVDPPFPDPLIKDLINNSYPALVSYARRIYDQAFKEGHSSIQFISSSSSLWALIPPWPKAPVHSKPKSQEDIDYSRLSWGFLGLAIGSLVAYLVVVGSQIKIVWEEQDIDVERDDSVDSQA